MGGARRDEKKDLIPPSPPPPAVIAAGCGCGPRQRIVRWLQRHLPALLQRARSDSLRFPGHPRAFLSGPRKRPCGRRTAHLRRELLSPSSTWVALIDAHRMWGGGAAPGLAVCRYWQWQVEAAADAARTVGYVVVHTGGGGGVRVDTRTYVGVGSCSGIRCRPYLLVLLAVLLLHVQRLQPVPTPAISNVPSRRRVRTTMGALHRHKRHCTCHCRGVWSSRAAVTGTQSTGTSRLLSLIFEAAIEIVRSRLHFRTLTLRRRISFEVLKGGRPHAVFARFLCASCAHCANCAVTSRPYSR